MAEGWLLALLRAVPNVQNFDCLLDYTVTEDKWQSNVGHFPGSFFHSLTSSKWKLLERSNRASNFDNRRTRTAWLSFLEISVNIFEILGGWCGPADLHLRLEHLLDAGFHFFFLYEVPAIGCFNALAHGGSKSRVVL